MALISLTVAVLLFVLLLYVMVRYVKMPSEVRNAIVIVAGMALILYVANTLGMMHELPAHLR